MGSNIFSKKKTLTQRVLSVLLALIMTIPSNATVFANTDTVSGSSDNSSVTGITCSDGGSASYEIDEDTGRGKLITKADSGFFAGRVNACDKNGDVVDNWFRVKEDSGTVFYFRNDEEHDLKNLDIDVKFFEHDSEKYPIQLHYYDSMYHEDKDVDIVGATKDDGIYWAKSGDELEIAVSGVKVPEDMHSETKIEAYEGVESCIIAETAEIESEDLISQQFVMPSCPVDVYIKEHNVRNASADAIEDAEADVAGILDVLGAGNETSEGDVSGNSAVNSKVKAASDDNPVSATFHYKDPKDTQHANGQDYYNLTYRARWSDIEMGEAEIEVTETDYPVEEIEVIPPVPPIDDDELYNPQIVTFIIDVSNTMWRADNLTFSKCSNPAHFTYNGSAYYQGMGDGDYYASFTKALDSWYTDPNGRRITEEPLIKRSDVGVTENNAGAKHFYGGIAAANQMTSLYSEAGLGSASNKGNANHNTTMENSSMQSRICWTRMQAAKQALKTVTNKIANSKSTIRTNIIVFSRGAYVPVLFADLKSDMTPFNNFLSDVNSAGKVNLKASAADGADNYDTYAPYWRVAGTYGGRNASNGKIKYTELLNSDGSINYAYTPNGKFGNGCSDYVIGMYAANCLYEQNHTAWESSVRSAAGVSATDPVYYNTFILGDGIYNNQDADDVEFYTEFNENGSTNTNRAEMYSKWIKPNIAKLKSWNENIMCGTLTSVDKKAKKNVTKNDSGGDWLYNYVSDATYNVAFDITNKFASKILDTMAGSGGSGGSDGSINYNRNYITEKKLGFTLSDDFEYVSNLSADGGTISNSGQTVTWDNIPDSTGSKNKFTAKIKVRLKDKNTAKTTLDPVATSGRPHMVSYHDVTYNQAHTETMDKTYTPGWNLRYGTIVLGGDTGEPIPPFLKKWIPGTEPEEFELTIRRKYNSTVTKSSNTNVPTTTIYGNIGGKGGTSEDSDNIDIKVKATYDSTIGGYTVSKIPEVNSRTRKEGDDVDTASVPLMIYDNNYVGNDHRWGEYAVYDYYFIESDPTSGWYKQEHVKNDSQADGDMSYELVNLPSKAKVKTLKIQKGTEGQSPVYVHGARFTVYEYNKTTGKYRPYRAAENEVAGSKSEIVELCEFDDNGSILTPAQAEKLDPDSKAEYMSTQWLYYTDLNQGKFLVKETIVDKNDKETSGAPKKYSPDYETDADGKVVNNEDGTPKFKEYKFTIPKYSEDNGSFYDGTKFINVAGSAATGGNGYAAYIGTVQNSNDGGGDVLVNAKVKTRLKISKSGNVTIYYYEGGWESEEKITEATTLNVECKGPDGKVYPVGTEIPAGTVIKRWNDRATLTGSESLKLNLAGGWYIIRALEAFDGGSKDYPIGSQAVGGHKTSAGEFVLTSKAKDTSALYDKTKDHWLVDTSQANGEKVEYVPVTFANETLAGISSDVKLTKTINIRYDATSNKPVIELYDSNASSFDPKSAKPYLTTTKVYVTEDSDGDEFTNDDVICDIGEDVYAGKYEIIEVKAPKGYNRQMEASVILIDTMAEIADSNEMPNSLDGVARVVPFTNELTKTKNQLGENHIKFPDPDDDSFKTYYASIKVEKTVREKAYKPGDTVHFDVTVTNDGDAEQNFIGLRDIVVTDTLKLGDDVVENVVLGRISSLATGKQESFTYEWTVPEGTNNGTKITNIARATGEGVDPNGKTHHVDSIDTAKATVEDGTNGVRIVKTADKPYVKPGEEIEYTIEVTNTTEPKQVLKNAVVEETLAGIEYIGNVKGVTQDGTTLTISEIKPDQTVVLMFRYRVPDDFTGSAITNTASVRVGGYSDEDEEKTTVYKPGIKVEKRAFKLIKKDGKTYDVTEPYGKDINGDGITGLGNVATYAAGETVCYEIKVTNTGKTGLKNIHVNENALEGTWGADTPHDNTDGAYIESLAAGRSRTLYFYYKTTASDDNSIMRNVVEATGINDSADSPEEEVRDTDTEMVSIGGFVGIGKIGLRDGKGNFVEGAKIALYAGTSSSSDDDVVDASGRVVYPHGALIAEGYTNKNGLLDIENAIYPGHYYMIEKEAPEGYYQCTDEIKIDATRYANQDNIDTIYVSAGGWFKNPMTKMVIKLRDEQTYNVIGNAQFKIVNSNKDTVTFLDRLGNERTAFTITNPEQGYEVYGLKPGVSYQLVEVEPKKPYLENIIRYNSTGNGEVMGKNKSWTNTIDFKLSDVAIKAGNDGQYNKPEAFELDITNDFARGEASISKEGELVDTWGIIEKGKWFFHSIFHWFDGSLAGVTYKVIAKGDIKHPDGKTGILYHDGDTVYEGVISYKQLAEKTTDWTGILKFEELYLGDYAFVEVSAPDGYVVDKTEIPFTLAYKGKSQNDAIVSAGVVKTVYNNRKIVSIDINKKDSETGEAISGAYFGLFAAEDIYDSQGSTGFEVIDEAGNQVMQPDFHSDDHILTTEDGLKMVKDTLIESITDEDGSATYHIVSDLPAGKYYIRELQAPTGYVKDWSRQEIVIDQDTEADADNYVNFNLTFENEPYAPVDDKETQEDFHSFNYNEGILIEKQAEYKAKYLPGDTVKYTFRVTNTGEVPVYDVKVTDTIKFGGTIQTVDLGTIAELGVNPVNLNKGKTYSNTGRDYYKEFTYEYTIPEDAQPGDKITDVARATGIAKGFVTKEVRSRSREYVNNEWTEWSEWSDWTVAEKVPTQNEVDSSSTREIKVSKEDGGIEVTKRSRKNVYKKGETAYFDVEVKNSSEKDLENVLVTESLDGIEFLDADTKGISVDGNKVTIAFLEAGALAQLHFAYHIPDDYAEETVYNKVTVTVDGEEDHDEAEVPVVNASIKVVKEADKERYMPGDTARYTIKVTNDGERDLKDIYLIDHLTGGKVRDNALVWEGGYQYTDKGICIPSIAKGQTLTIHCTYKVQDEDNAGVLKNWAQATGTTVPELPDEDSLIVRDDDTELTAVGKGLRVGKISSKEGTSDQYVAGAVIGFYAAEDIYDMTTHEVIYKKDALVHEHTTEDNAAYIDLGKGVILPDGRYYMKELSAPEGYYPSNQRIELDLSDQSDKDPDEIVYVDGWFRNPQTKMTLWLRDDETFNPISGAKFEILDSNGNNAEFYDDAGKKVTDFTITDVDAGYTINGLKPGEEYTLIETTAREGYMKAIKREFHEGNGQVTKAPDNEAAKISFVIPEQITGVNGNKITGEPDPFKLSITNMFVRGKATINKHGKILETWESTRLTLEKVKTFFSSIFGWNDGNMQDVRFQVIAVNDIEHPDGKMGTVYKAGDVVQEGVTSYKRTADRVTDIEGLITVSDLYLGNYAFVEVETDDQHILESEPHTFALVWDGDEGTLIKELPDSPKAEMVGAKQLVVENPRKHVSISVIKNVADKDGELTGEQLPGATFGLYAAEDIVNYYKETIVAKDTLLETITNSTDDSGKAIKDEEGNIVYHFESDLPVGQYYVKELTAPSKDDAPEGYVTSIEDINNDGADEYIISKDEREETRPDGKWTIIDAVIFNGYGIDRAENGSPKKAYINATGGNEDIVETISFSDKAITGKYHKEIPPRDIDPSIASIEVEKLARNATYKAGETAQYTITVRNNGGLVLKDVKVVDKLNYNGEITESLIGEIASLGIDEVKSFNYEWTVPENAQGGTKIKNIVIGTGSAIDETGQTQDVEDIKEASIKVAKGLDVVKTSDKTSYKAGDTAYYTVRVANNTDKTLENVHVEDHLEGIEYVSSDIEGVTADGTSVTIAILKPGQEAQLKYIYRIPEDYALKTLKNTVTVSVDGSDESDEDDSEVTVYKPSIKITKRTDGIQYKVGDTVRYTITVENDGDMDLMDVYVRELAINGQWEEKSYEKTAKGLLIPYMSIGDVITLHYLYTVEEADDETELINHVRATGSTVPEDDTTPSEVIADDDSELVFISDEPAIGKIGISKGHASEFIAGAEISFYADEDILDPVTHETLYKKHDFVFSQETTASPFMLIDATEDTGTAFLPAGKYYMKETKAPEGYYPSTQVISLDLSAREENEPYKAYTNDWFRNVRSKMMLRVRDEKTFNVLSGATFRIVDAEGAAVAITNNAGNKVTSFTTSSLKEGYEINGLNPGEAYKLVEVMPRAGYTDTIVRAITGGNGHFTSQAGGNSLDFVIDIPKDDTAEGTTVKDHKVIDAPEPFELDITNMFVTGNARIYKTGEILESWSLTEKAGKLFHSIFNWVSGDLEAVNFQVAAREDIVHPDGMTGIVYKAGDIVDMGVASIKELADVDTDSAGLAQFTGLYPGQYALVEVATRSGYKLLDKPVYFSIDYQGPKTLVVEALDGGKSIVNEREKVTITIKKYDSKYKKKNQDQAVNLEGAQFGIYTQDPIKNGYNKEIVPKNTQLEVIEYNPEIGGYRFESELPHGTYYIKELKAPKGYKKTGKKYVIDATDGKESYEFELTIYNSKKKGSGKHHKKDKDNKNNGNGGNGGNGNGGNGNGSGIGATGRTGNGFARNVKTGDTSNALLYVIIALLLMAGCGVWFVRRRRAGRNK